MILLNCGDLDAKLSTYEATGTSESGPIKISVTGLANGTALPKTNGTHTVTIEGEYDSSVTSEPTAEQKTKTVKVTANYVQNLGD